MAKKCIVCDKDAEFCVKGSSEYYCEECAQEHFADISYLQKVEEQARMLKKLVEDNTDDQ